MTSPAPRRRRPLPAADRYRDMPDVLALLGYTRPAWHADALCKEYPDVDFVSPLKRHINAAMQICGRCAVRAECLDYALAEGELLQGVWGGTTQQARRVMRRARRQTDATP